MTAEWHRLTDLVEQMHHAAWQRSGGKESKRPKPEWRPHLPGAEAEDEQDDEDDET